MTAHWLQKSSEGTYDYDVVASFRGLESSEWSEGRVVHSDGVSSEHGFVSMLPMPEDRTFITWLDGRNTVAKHGGDAGGRHGAAGMTLRAGVFDMDGATLSEWELDGLTCDCCQTSSAMTTQGPVVVYRDRSTEEIRDIYITRLLHDEWTTPAPVFKDDWQIAGCPVNGPSVAAKGEQLAVAWFSAKDDLPTVSLRMSSDSGATFSPRVIVTRSNTNGRVSTAILDSRNVAVSWLETDGADAKIMLDIFNPSGERLSRTFIAETLSSRQSGFPVIAARGNNIYVTWTDVESRKEVKVARVQF